MGKGTGRGLEDKVTEVMFHRWVQNSPKKEGQEATAIQVGERGDLASVVLRSTLVLLEALPMATLAFFKTGKPTLGIRSWPGAGSRAVPLLESSLPPPRSF